jgi:hypothetical protein
MSSKGGMVVEPATPERKDGGRDGRLSMEAKYHLRQVYIALDKMGLTTRSLLV